MISRRPAIEINNVSKRYRLGEMNAHWLRAEVERRLLRSQKPSNLQTKKQTEFWALKHISLNVEPGEVVGIIGSNGAGKSTLLKILSRVTEATEGEIHMRGRVASLLEVGTGFHPELSGRENIFLNGAILGISRAETARKFDEIVDFSEVEKFLDTPVKRYSSGMYVRLAFAVAAHLEPEILIVDEVLAVGDARFQAKCLKRLKDVSRAGHRTILFVSHNLAAIEATCSRSVLLSDGLLTSDGPNKEVIAKYLALETVKDAGVDADAPVAKTHAKQSKLIARVLVNGSDKNPTLEIGSNLTIDIEFKERVSSVAAVVGIYNQDNLLVADCDGTQASNRDKWDASSCRIFLYIEKLALVPGEYYINIAVLRQGQMVDHLPAAATFEIRASEYEGRIILERVRGIYVPSYKWNA